MVGKILNFKLPASKSRSNYSVKVEFQAPRGKGIVATWLFEAVGVIIAYGDKKSLEVDA